MPEEVNRVVADHLSRWLFAPTPTAVENLRAEGITEGVVLVGDLMQDLAARVGREVATAEALAAASRHLAATTDGPDLTPGGYLFATVHRAENRQPAALAPGRRSSIGSPAPDRPVILAIHPGTRLALEREGIELSPAVRLVDPQGYRTSLTLQLHAAAVLTDSGGVQREAAWLGVPCLVLRDTTEWVEAVAGSGGRMVIVGLDAELAERALAGLAPPDGRAGAGPRARRRLRPARRPAPPRRSSRRWRPRNDRGPAARLRVVMFVYNDVSRDSRVLREAKSLADAGHQVLVIGRPRSPDERADHAPGAGRLRDRARPDARTSGAPGGTGSGSRGTCAASSSAGSSTTSAADRPAGSARSPIVGVAILVAIASLIRLPFIAISGGLNQTKHDSTFDWLIRWRWGVLGWARTAAAAAPARGRVPRPRPDRPAGGGPGPGRQGRRGRLRQPRVVHGLRLERQPAGVGQVDPAPVRATPGQATPSRW